MPELTSELQQLADDAARHARPSAAADIFAAGHARRRRSRTRQALSGLSAAGVAGAGVALGLALTSSAPGCSASTAAHRISRPRLATTPLARIVRSGHE